MKWILLLLLSFNLQAQTVNCGLKSHAEIDACSVDDKLPELIKRLFPSYSYKPLGNYNQPDTCNPLTVDNEETEEIEVCPIWNPKEDSFTYIDQSYNEDNLPELSFYDRLLMESKPSLEVFELDLASWKSSTKNDLDFKLSVKNMNRFRRRMVKCGYSEPNMELLKLEIIKQKDITKKDCLSSQTAELDIEDSKEGLRNAIIKDMSFARSLQVDFISLIRSGGKNPAKNKRLLVKLSTVQNLLNVGDIEGARDELSSIASDSDLSQGAKDMVISKMNSYLGE